ncbi:FtsX-like permease family protein [Streptomyces botrytidirepellens]|uniref:FtsX-like permease family protein n=1 Tax=Streptomyces botrytidirepellens TaxID=2486417 RepID=A0A3M8XEE9_9ACTN|nr:FtsX-like permease family protein [Streptomyces botrytidirepellens]RNG38843.1 FtsX-like permease family protein [Streptomyces botrytidirepellens]
MSAVWAASRAVVKRRKVQTAVIGLVVLCSTTTILLTLALLSAASAPFERAFGQQRGAHVVAAFDRAKVSDTQLARTAGRPGVQAAAGPYLQAVVDLPEQWLWVPSGPLTVVGRSDPAGTVDRIRLLEGRWATKPGEIVVNVQGTPGPDKLGTQLKVRGAPALTVVGFATSMSKSAGAWVAPEQMAALHPASVQMLYRFTQSSTDRQIRDSLSEATARLPTGSLTTTQSSLTLKRAFSAGVDSYLPFLTVFGILGLLISALIVGNVVSGVVVSGYRHIGVLKALGFTPNQVVAVYLTMVSVPAVAGCVVGTLIGDALSQPILRDAFSGIETGSAAIGVSPWVYAVCLLGMPALAILAALVPALRAHRLSASRAISAGNAPRTGRGLRIQRGLSGTRLPRAVSLGLGQPFARPGRTLMTMGAIVLGVTTVTLTTGLTSTMVAFGKHGQSNGAAWVNVEAGRPGLGQKAPKLSDRQIEERLRSLPGADLVTARALTKVRLAGYTQTAFANFYRGDTQMYDSEIVRGHWPHGRGEVAAAPAFLNQHGLVVGDRITLYLNGRQARVTVVGELIEGNPQAVESTWQTLAELAPDLRAVEYTVALAEGADAEAYAKAVKASGPGLYLLPGGSTNTTTATVVSFSAVFTVLLTIVAALGVFNTVLLNTRERRRDLGMLKSIGMTPRQVTVMTVTSVAGLGAVGGLLGIPLGIAAHRLLVDHVGVVAFPESMKDVWHAPQLAVLALAGVVIAVLGALIPARSAARLTIAKVLHNE